MSTEVQLFESIDISTSCLRTSMGHETYNVDVKYVEEFQVNRLEVNPKSLRFITNGFILCAECYGEYTRFWSEDGYFKITKKGFEKIEIEIV